ncbi:hypothetical protein DSL72_009403 [Monilinia vaccinii-corymbosi]|uniref:Uncharacterized protein n=1 Tax=Monilinia vaccinii-corymbosi TaxID=61207 RepID=A0A8A3PR01_9HELO|nr:hypothetical protein DSL72_009403 [Monilinia vaccinii-corymbosi]
MSKPESQGYRSILTGLRCRFPQPGCITLTVIDYDGWGVLSKPQLRERIFSLPIKPLINRTLTGWCDKVSDMLEAEPTEYAPLCEKKYTDAIFGYTAVFNKRYEAKCGLLEDFNKPSSDGRTMHIRSAGYGVGVLLRYMMMDRIEAASIRQRIMAKNIRKTLQQHVPYADMHSQRHSSQISLKKNKREQAVAPKENHAHAGHDHARDRVMRPEEFQGISEVRPDNFRMLLSARLEAEILQSKNPNLRGRKEPNFNSTLSLSTHMILCIAIA